MGLEVVEVLVDLPVRDPRPVALDLEPLDRQEGLDDLDSKAVAMGIEDAIGKKEQKLKDEELAEAFSFLQKRSEERMAKLNEESAQAGKKFLEENGKKDGVKTTESGLQYEVVKKAEGAQPKASDVVTVHYEGKLIDGTVFDSSIQRNEPAEFQLVGVVPCWREAVQKMKKGQKAQIVCPSSLAYGDRGSPPDIPPGSTLSFEVELLDFHK